MRKSGGLALGAIVLAAVGLRWSPLLSFVFWGADIGEYYAILRDLAATGHVSLDYGGWGATYPYFPGLFFTQAALASFAPVDLVAVLSLVAPAFGALAVLPGFLLAATITRETKVGLLAAAILAVAMPHVYSTSHTAPSTVGNLLAFAGLLVFLRLPRDRKALLPAIALSAAVVLTHHLSTYFLIVMVLFGIVVRGLLRRDPGPSGERREAAALGALLGIAFAFWFGYATPFRDGILGDVDVEPWWLIPAAFPALLALLAVLLRLRRRVAWRYRPRYPDPRRTILVYGAMIAFTLGLLGYSATWAIPGTGVRLPLAVFAYFAPLYGLIAFAAPGRKFFDFLRRATSPTGWLAGLVLSVAFGAVLAPRVIIPYRHIEYLLLPVALFAGMGLVRLVDLRGAGPPGRAWAAILVGGLLLGNAAIAFPPPSILVGWQEGMRPSALDASYWLRAHGDGLLAADHRASTLAFGFGGIDATWDRARVPFLSTDPAAILENLTAIDAPSGVRDASYVWIDRDTEAGVQLFPWEPAVPMGEDTIATFSEAPFVKVFDNGYARLYWIAWGCDGSC